MPVISLELFPQKKPFYKSTKRNNIVCETLAPRDLKTNCVKINCRCKYIESKMSIVMFREKQVNGGELIEYVRKGLICKPMEDTVNLNSEIILSEITIENNKWAIFCAYRPEVDTGGRTQPTPVHLFFSSK